MNISLAGPRSEGTRVRARICRLARRTAAIVAVGVIATLGVALASSGNPQPAPLGIAPIPVCASPAADAGGGVLTQDSIPQLMPIHPDLLRKIAAEGYDSVTLLDLRNLAVLKEESGIDRPEPIERLVTGTRPALVLLADFSDLTHNAASTPALYNNLLFSVGTYTPPGSMRDFFREASYGLFDVSPGSVDSAWRATSRAHNYYANADGIAGTADDYGLGSWPQNAQQLVVDAVTLADPYVNFASYAVSGQVQGLFVVHTGRGAETDSSKRDWIWSHKWGLNTHAMTVDGVTVNLYSMEPEYVFSPGDSTIGVFCHEYGHVLGLPDLYDTDYTSEGLGNWSLMAGGSWNGSSGTSPAHPDAWSKIQLGWVAPNLPTVGVLGASIPNAEGNPFAYKLWTNGAPGSEYFLLENRQRRLFDAGLPSAGILLYHVDENAVQTADWHPKVMLEQADGLWNLQYATNRGDAGDPYPGSTTNRTANATTTPNTRSYAAGDTYVSVSSISNSGLTMTADILVALLSPLVAEAGGDKLIDSGDSTTLEGSASGGAVPYSYSWLPTTGLNDPAVAQPTASPTETTIYTLTVTDNLGQTDSDTMTVTVQTVTHTLSVTAQCDPTTVASAGMTSCTAAPADSQGHGIATWAWDDGGAGGVFSPSAAVQSPAYTAPANISGSDITVTLTVSATCAGPAPLSDSDSTSLTVQTAAGHTLWVSAGCVPATVASGGTTACSATAGDSQGHGVAWSWSDGGAGGVFSPSALVQNPSYSAPLNYGASDISVTLTVTATCDGPSPLVDSDATTLTVQPAAVVFADVPASHPFRRFIEAIYREGITGGCAIDPLRFCPTAEVTREIGRAHV